MSDSSYYYSGYAREVAEAKQADHFNFEKCVCRETGLGRICRNTECPDTKWAKQQREPVDRAMAREIEGGWEIAYPHLHKCDCSSSRRWWRIYDQQKQHRMGKSVEY